MGTRTPPPSPCWAGADLHEVRLPQISEGHAVLRMGGVSGLDGREAMLSAYRWAISATSSRLLPSRAAAARWYRAPRRPAPLVVLAVGSYRISSPGDHLTTLRRPFLASFMACLPGQLVAGVVQGQQQHAVALVRHLHGIKHQLAVGGGEDITHRLDVQHTLAHKTGLGGLMAGAARR